MVNAPIVVIRRYKEEDASDIRKLLSEAAQSTVNTAFIKALFLEATYEAIIFVIGISFIFFGVPLQYTVLLVPVVFCGVYLLIYSAHVMKSLEIQMEVTSIPTIYGNHPASAFWVAEMYRPALDLLSMKKPEYYFTREDQIANMSHELKNLKRELVGTIAVTPCRTKPGTGWIRRFTVAKKYRRKGLGSRLLSHVQQWAAERGLQNIETVTTECQEAGRELLLNRRFQLRGQYHRYVLTVIPAVLVYQFSGEVKANQGTLEI